MIDATFAVTDRERAQYSLLHAVASNFAPVTVGAGGPPSELAGLPINIDQEEIQFASRYVDDLAERLAATGIAATAAVESGRSVARTVVDYATRMHADLIAVGTCAAGHWLGDAAGDYLTCSRSQFATCGKSSRKFPI